VNLPHPYNRYAGSYTCTSTLEICSSYCICNEEKENFFTKLRRAIWEWSKGFNGIGIQ